MDSALLGFQIFCRIPFDYLHGTIVPAEISVIDQFGRKYRSDTRDSDWTKRLTMSGRAGQSSRRQRLEFSTPMVIAIRMQLAD